MWWCVWCVCKKVISSIDISKMDNTGISPLRTISELLYSLQVPGVVLLQDLASLATNMQRSGKTTEEREMGRKEVIFRYDNVHRLF